MAISSQHKVYIPDTAKDSQYMLAEFQLSQAFFACFPDENSCYRQLSQQFFKLTDAAGLTNVHFIANDKMPVVRFHTEAFCFQTADQMLFFYNPAYHEAQHCWYNSHYRARKISLLCLATGDEIRNKAAGFHAKVQQVMLDFKALLPQSDIPFKIRDHQHLSYDLFARAKGCDSSFGYKLRSLPTRYQARGTTIPKNHHTMSYAAVSLPLCRELKQRLLPESATGYATLYQNLEQHFASCAKAQHLTRLAMIADGSTPLVRNRQLDKSRQSPELTMLSFDTSSPQTQLISQWQDEQLVDTAHLLLVAGQDDNTEFGYGRFMNQVEQSLRQLAQQLGLQKEKQDFTVRFHQHLSYLLE